MSKPILVVGATRGTGLIVATRLLEEGHDVRIIARNLMKARAAFGTSAEIVHADLSAPSPAFADAFRDVSSIVFTAAVPPGPAPEDLIRSVDYNGVLLTLLAARAQAFEGRFIYLTTIGTTHHSFSASFLDLVKKNLMYWRRQADKAIRTSGLHWTIVRAGMLENAPAGSKPVKVIPGDIPLRMRNRIGRGDVAEVILQSLVEPRTVGQDYSVMWTSDQSTPSIQEQLAQIGT